MITEENFKLDYSRVEPRDLFMEAMLLKCIAFVIMHIQDGKAGELTYQPQFPNDHGYICAIDQTSGDHKLMNFKFYIHGFSEIILYITPYSKSPNPLMAKIVNSDIECQVLNKNGQFTEDFKLIILQS